MNGFLATTIPTALLALTFGASLEAQPVERRHLPSPLAALIESADADQDGVVTRAELAKVDVFAKLDTNQDGKLDSADVDHVFVFHAAPHGAFLLRLADEDRDGKLTRADWQAFIAEADADGDGLLQHEELRSVLPAPPEPPKAPEAPEAPEAPRAPREFRQPLPPMAPMPPRPPMAPEPPELDGADLAATFDRFDKNKDGLLDGDELPPSRFMWQERLPHPGAKSGKKGG